MGTSSTGMGVQRRGRKTSRRIPLSKHELVGDKACFYAVTQQMGEYVAEQLRITPLSRENIRFLSSEKQKAEWTSPPLRNRP